MGGTDVIGRPEGRLLWRIIALFHEFNENPENFISWFLTMDEIWLRLFNPESKMRNTAWKHAPSLHPRKFHIISSAHKKRWRDCILKCWRVVLMDDLEHGSTITEAYYADINWKVGGALNKMRKVVWQVVASLGQCTCTQIISSTGSQQKFQIWTSPSPTIFTRVSAEWLLFVFQPEEILKRTKIYWRGRCMHGKLLAGKPRQQFFY